jgi:hypothetical protein
VPRGRRSGHLQTDRRAAHDRAVRGTLVATLRGPSRAAYGRREHDRRHPGAVRFAAGHARRRHEQVTAGAWRTLAPCGAPCACGPMPQSGIANPARR